MKNNMADFDYDKIKDMEYDPNRGCYVGKNGEEFHVTPYSNGSGINMIIMTEALMEMHHIIRHM